MTLSGRLRLNLAHQLKRNISATATHTARNRELLRSMGLSREPKFESGALGLCLCQPGNVADTIRAIRGSSDGSIAQSA